MQVNDVLGLSAPLEAIMREAGELARATARQPFRRWTKGTEGSPVTEGDIAVNDLLHGQLSKLIPGAAWLSEESRHHLPDRVSPLLWIVDPIDGTRAYISGRADWTISVALAEQGRPQLRLSTRRSLTKCFSPCAAQVQDSTACRFMRPLARPWREPDWWGPKATSIGC